MIIKSSEIYSNIFKKKYLFILNSLEVNSVFMIAVLCPRDDVDNLLEDWDMVVTVNKHIFVQEGDGTTNVNETIAKHIKVLKVLKCTK